MIIDFVGKLGLLLLGEFPGSGHFPHSVFDEGYRALMEVIHPCELTDSVSQTVCRGAVLLHALVEQFKG